MVSVSRPLGPGKLTDRVPEDQAMPLTVSTLPSAQSVFGRGRMLRELSPPPRIDSDRKVDLPEIQAPYRVSFSDQARAAEAIPVRDPRQSGDIEINARALKAYRDVARL